MLLLLVCGLPGAGKTTLARRAAEQQAVVASAAASDWRLQRLSFDDLFRADTVDGDEFDPVMWKRCQREMAERVRSSQAQAQESSTASGQRVVLLVDDNFQLRSLRKRFARLATEGAQASSSPAAFIGSQVILTVCVCVCLRSPCFASRLRLWDPVCQHTSRALS